VDLVFGQTEGNAFFVEEVLKHLREEGRLFGADGRVRSDFKSEEVDVPEGVRLVIGWRLLRLTEECRRTLSLAAVIGRGFSFELLEAAGEIEDDDLLDAIDEAERAQLIYEMEGDPKTPFVFTHELIRQTLLSLISAARRQRMHLRVADAMERIYAAELAERSADIAHHLVSAGGVADAARTVLHLTAAGDRALDAAAFEDGERYFATALSLMGDEKSAARADLLFNRGWALRSTGRWDEALVIWREALGLYETLGDSASVARIAADITQQLLWDAKFIEAMEIVRRGLSAGAEVPKTDRCRLLAAGALVLSAAGSYAAAKGMIDEALDLANEIGDRRLLGQVLGYQCTHHWCFTQADTCCRSGEAAADLCRETGDIWYLTTILGFVIQAHLYAGRLNDVARVLQELAPLAEALGHVGTKLNLIRAEGESEFLRTGDLKLYRSLSEADVQFCLEADLPWVSVAYTRVGMSALWGGRWSEAVEPSRQAVSREPPGFWKGIDSGRLALIMAYVGMPQDCHAALEAAGLDPSAEGPLTAGQSSLILCATEAFSYIGEKELVRSLRPGVNGIHPSVKLFPASSTLCEAVRGIAAACDDDLTAAREHFDTALRQSQEIPHRIGEAETERWYGWALKEAGEWEEARGHLQRAVELYERYGMPRHVELAKQLLAGL
jgi:tetratricopeptide (TPR) repeat protein